MDNEVAQLGQIQGKDVPDLIRALFFVLRGVVMQAHAAGINSGPLNPNVAGITTVNRFGWNGSDWVVHAACHVDVLIQFLFDALREPQQVGLVTGPHGAPKLGIFHQPIPNLQIYQVQ